MAFKAKSRNNENTGTATTTTERVVFPPILTEVIEMPLVFSDRWKEGHVSCKLSTCLLAYGI